MGFASNGIYTPPAAAENAFTGKTISSTDWNAIFTDIANALTLLGAANTSIPTTVTNDASVAVTDSTIINNKTGSTLTLTLPLAASFPGRHIWINSIQAQLVNSASSNVIPRAGGSAGAAIINATTAGSWAHLQSDGSNWKIVAGLNTP